MDVKLCTLTISFDKDSSMQKVGSLYCPEVENLKKGRREGICPISSSRSLEEVGNSLHP